MGRQTNQKENIQVFTSEYLELTRKEIEPYLIEVSTNEENNDSRLGLKAKREILKYFNKIVTLESIGNKNREMYVNVVRELIRWLFILVEYTIPSNVLSAQTSTSSTTIDNNKEENQEEQKTEQLENNSELLRKEFLSLLENDLQFYKKMLNLIIKLLFINESKTLHRHIQWGLQQLLIAKNKNNENTLHQQVYNLIVEIFNNEMKLFTSQLFNYSKENNTEEQYFTLMGYQIRQLDHFLELDINSFNELIKDHMFIILEKTTKIIQLNYHNINSKSDWIFIVLLGSLKIALAFMTRCANEIEILFEKARKGIDLEEKLKNNLVALNSLFTFSLVFVVDQAFPRDCKRIGSLIVLRLLDYSIKDKSKTMQLIFDIFLSKSKEGNELEFKYSLNQQEGKKEAFSTETLHNLFNEIYIQQKNIVETFNLLLNNSSDLSIIATFTNLISVFGMDRLDVVIEHEGKSYNLLFDGFYKASLYFCNETKDSDMKLLSLASFSDSLLSLKKYLVSKQEEKKERELEVYICNLIKKSLDIVWNNFENSIYNIFERMKQLFIDLMDLRDLLTIKDEIDLDALTNHLLNLDWGRKGKYLSLVGLLPKVGGKQIITLCPEIFSNTLEALGVGNGTVNANATMFYEKLVIDLLQDCNSDKNKIQVWEERCLYPIINIIGKCNKQKRSAILIHLIPKIIKINPKECTNYLLEQLRKAKNESCSNVDSYLHSFVHVLKIAKSFSYEIDYTKDLDLLEEAIIHREGDLRIEALELITCSIKKTAIPSVLELEMVMRFVKYNLRACKSAFRFAFATALERFIKRIRETCLRIYGQYEKKQLLGHLLVSDLDETKINTKILADLKKDRHSYGSMMRFLSEYATEVLNALYPGCPHERLFVALDCYKSLLVTFAETTTIDIFKSEEKQPKDIVVPWKRINLFSETMVLTLLNTFGSCWDKVRSTIYDLLMMFPSPLPAFETPEKVKIIVSNAFELIKSPRLRESDAGSLLFKLLFNKYVNKLQWELSLDSESEIVPTKHNSPELLFCKKLVGLLQKKTQSCMDNIFNITKESSLVGILQTLTYIISDLDFSKERNNIKEWKELFESLTTTIERACQLSVKIIAGIDFDDNGEGSDLNINVDCRGHIYFNEDDEIEGDVHTLTVNCWLAVKCCAILISTMVEKVELTPNPKELTKLYNDISPLSVEQIEKLGGILLNILLKTKHNGAIEKSAVGMFNLAKRLLTCGVAELIDVPSKWIDYLCNGILKEDTFATILRRSAGLPWTFAAICKAEPTYLPRILLPRTMEFCLNIARNRENYTMTQVVHCLNVLKFLFHDTNLGPYVQHYVEEGFITALKGFGSPVWAIRNSSLMMYTSLLHRSFGDNETIKTGMEFFSRYPLLRTFLLEQLKEVTDSKQRALHPSLYPMLLLLSRLRPSLENKEENKGLSDFIPFVQNCSLSIHYMARSISSRALEPLISTDLTKQFIEGLILHLTQLSINVNNSKIQNELHGTMLQLYRFITSITMKGLEDLKEFSATCLLKLSSLNYIADRKLNPCFMTRSIYFNILVHLIQYCNVDNISKEVIETILCYSLDSIFGDDEGTIGHPGKQEMLYNASSLTITCYLLSNQPVDNELILQLLNFPVMEVRRAVVKFITKSEHFRNIQNNLSKWRYLRMIILEHIFQVEDDIECIRFGLMGICNLYLLLKDNNQIDNIFEEVKEMNIDNFLETIWNRLVYLYAKETNTFLQEQSLILQGLIINSIIMNVNNNEKYIKMVEQWKIMINDGSQSSASHVRSGSLQSIYHSNILNENINNQFIPLKVLILLLQDEEVEIRDEATKLLSNIISPGNDLQREYVLEKSFLLLRTQFGNLKECKEFLFNNIKLEEIFNEEINEIEPILPFRTSYEEIMLFDKEDDNLFREELHIVQLCICNLSPLLSEEERIEYSKVLKKQLEKVISILSENKKQQLGLFWIGNCSFHPKVFVLLARLLIAISCLGKEENINYLELLKEKIFTKQEISTFNELLQNNFFSLANTV